MNSPLTITTDRARTTRLATPVAPAARGVGVEQRAFRTAAALAAKGPLETVVCRPRWASWLARARGGPADAHALAPRLDPMPAEMVLRRAALAWPGSGVLGALAGASAAFLPVAAPIRARGTVERFHAFRLAAAGALPKARRAEIDLDDLESEVARAIAGLAKKVGDHAVAGFYEALAARIGALERSVVPRFDRAYVGSAADAEWLRLRTPGVEVRVLPNVVDVADVGARPPREPGPVRLLYVGALAYYPNIDALRRLLDPILPALRTRTRDFELHVVGRGAPAWLARRLAAEPSVVFHGGVPEMAPHYARADAVVVPLRAGGGTRIKLLEAFAAGVPVVSTSVGAFGLDVVSGRHLVLADEDAALGDALAALIADPATLAPLAATARAFVASRHTPAVFAAALE